MSNPQFMNLVFSMEFKFTSGIYFFIQAIFLSSYQRFIQLITFNVTCKLTDKSVRQVSS